MFSILNKIIEANSAHIYTLGTCTYRQMLFHLAGDLNKLGEPNTRSHYHKNNINRIIVFWYTYHSCCTYMDHTTAGYLTVTILKTSIPSFSSFPPSPLLGLRIQQLNAGCRCSIFILSSQALVYTYLAIMLRFFCTYKTQEKTGSQLSCCDSFVHTKRNRTQVVAVSSWRILHHVVATLTMTKIRIISMKIENDALLATCYLY